MQAVVDAATDREKRARDADLSAAWHTEAFRREKRLRPLQHYLNKRGPSAAPSPPPSASQRQAAARMAQQMAARRHRPAKGR